MDELDQAIVDAAIAVADLYGPVGDAYGSLPRIGALVTAIQAKRDAERPQCHYWSRGMHRWCGEPAAQVIEDCAGSVSYRCEKHRSTVKTIISRRVRDLP